MIKVAQIINTHGLKGECKLYLVTDDPQHRFEKGRVLHLEDGRTLTVVRYREQKGFGYCYFEGVDSIEKAEQLKTKNLFMGWYEKGLVHRNMKQQCCGLATVV